MVRWNFLAVISIGTVVITAQLFFLIGAGTGNFPEPWFNKALIYFVMTLGVFGFSVASTEKFEQQLFSKPFIKSFAKMLLFGAITFVILLAVNAVFKPEILSQIAASLSGIPWYVKLFHALVVGIDETLVFQVFFPNQFKKRGLSKTSIYIGSGFLFAIFHYWMAGGEWTLLLPYVPLSAIWLFIRYKYGWESAAGSHGLGYNPFILGFM